MGSLKPLVGVDCNPPLHDFWRCLISIVTQKVKVVSPPQKGDTEGKLAPDNLNITT